MTEVADEPHQQHPSQKFLHLTHGERGRLPRRTRGRRMSQRDFATGKLAVLVDFVVRVLLRLELEGGVCHVKVVREACTERVEQLVRAILAEHRSVNHDMGRKHIGARRYRPDMHVVYRHHTGL